MSGGTLATVHRTTLAEVRVNWYNTQGQLLSPRYTRPMMMMVLSSLVDGRVDRASNRLRPSESHGSFVDLEVEL
jgi:hypothetical protein